MAASVTIRVHLNRFPEMPSKMRAAAGKRIHAAGFRVEGDAKGRAAVDTGAMRASISNRPTGALSTVIGVGVSYAAYQEFGTRFQSGTPFMRPAMEAEAPRLEASFKGIEGDL